MAPLVSICIPNLNNRAFLAERIESIRSQSFHDWEVIVSDNYSDDGAWEALCSLAGDDPRFSLSQAPRDGMYKNWNRCIERARGKYVYIATSDDTMAADLLEKLTRGLEKHPDCGLAHCPLRNFDVNGTGLPDWWSTGSTFARSCGEMLYQSHRRLAPLDGLLHLIGESVYLSITQLLIRRSVFGLVGDFNTRFGAIADFHWAMKVGLAVNTLHVPDTWGGWRIHAAQATASSAIGTLEHRRRTESMIANVIDEYAPRFLPTDILLELHARVLPRFSEAREFAFSMRKKTTRKGRQVFLAKRLISGSWAARRYLYWRLLEYPRIPDWSTDAVRQVLEEKLSRRVIVSVNDAGEERPGDMRSSDALLCRN